MKFFLFVPAFFFFFSFFFLPFSLSPVWAATGINKQINFQGKLVDNNGLNVADSTYSIIFSIYNVSSGGSATWTETDSVTTVGGVFQVALGSVSPLPGSIDFNQDTWYLGIKVSTETSEMTPRIRLAAVPYAFNAATVGGITGTSNADGFQFSGGTTSRTATVTGADITLGSTIKPTSSGALTVQSNGANGLTLDTGAAAAISIGTGNASAITFGNSGQNTTLTLNGSGLTTLGGNLTVNGSQATFAGSVDMKGPNPFYDVKAYGAKGDGSTDDTTAIQNAITAASASGGEVFFPPGTYESGTLTLYSKVHLVGSGIESTIIQLKNSANQDLIQGQNFWSLTGGNTTGGIYSWSIENLSLDGNKTNNTSGDGIRVYGYAYILQNIRVRNFANDGIYSEWSTSGSSTANADGMEAHVYGLKVHGNSGNGINWDGPHDSTFTNMQVYTNGAKNIWLAPQGNGAMFVNLHTWGSSETYGVYIETSGVMLTGSTAEGASIADVMIGSGSAEIVGGSYYEGGAANADGIEIGDANHSVNIADVLINTSLNSFTNGHSINFIHDAGHSSITAIVDQASGTAYGGTPSATSSVNIQATQAGQGLTVMGLSGNVGINNASPLANLDIGGSASLSGNITFRTGSGHGLNLDDGGSLLVKAAPSGEGDSGLTTVFNLQNSGNIILTTNTLTDSSSNSQTIGFNNSRGIVGYDGPNASAFLEGASGKNLELQTNGANTRLFITNQNGFIGIGTGNSTSLLGNAMLTVNQTNASGLGDIFTASSSGITKFTIANNGAITGTNWSVTSAGALTVSSCSGCGGGSASLQSAYNSGQTIDLSNGGSLLNTGLTLGTNAGNGNVLISPNAGGQAALIIKDQGVGDLFTASAGATPKFVIQNAGNVGIGISNPGYALDVGNNGNVNISGKNIYFNGAQRISDTVTSGATTILPQGNIFSVYNGVNNENFKIWDSSGTYDLQFFQNGSTSSQIWSNGLSVLNLQANNSGSVGINTDIPLASTGLDIEKNALGNAAFVVNQLGVGDLFTASAGASTKFVIQNSGNVGIGTNSPANLVTLNQSSSGSEADLLQLHNGAATTNSGAGLIFNLTGGASATQAKIVATRTNAAFSFDTDMAFYNEYNGSNFERLLLQANGGIGVNTTSIGNGQLVINQPNSSGDILSASASGNTKFTIGNDGSINSVSGASTGNGFALNVNSLTTGNGFLVNSTGSITGAGNLVSLVGNSATSGDLLAVSGTGLTTGYGINVTGGATVTTGGDLYLNGAVYTHTAAETGSLATIKFTDSSTYNSASSQTQSIGLNIVPTFGATGASATHEIYGEYVQGLTISGTPTGTNNAYGIRVGNQGGSGVTTAYGLYVDTQSGATNNYAAIFNGGEVGINTLTPDSNRPLSIEGMGANSELLSFKNTSGTTLFHFNLKNSGFNISETGVKDGRIFIAPGGHIGINNTTNSTSVNAALTVNQTNEQGNGDIFAASAAGTTVFRITNGGSVVFQGDPLNIGSGASGNGSNAIHNDLGDTGSLLPNPGFESALLTSPADGWFPAATTSAGVFSQDTSVRAKGDASLKITQTNNVVAIYSSCVPVSGTIGKYILNYYAIGSTATKATVGSFIDGYSSKANCQSDTSPTSVVVKVAPTTASWAAYGTGVNTAIASFGSTSIWARVHFIISTSGTSIVTNIDGVRLTEDPGSTGNGGLDYAENYEANPTDIPQPGDVVEINSLNGTSVVEKANTSSGNSIIGIISTNPGQVLDDGSMTRPVPVALAGRVPVKVSTQNGPIHVGDFLAASTIPGVAVKAIAAGQVIGVAMQEDTDADTSAVNQITVFIKNTYFDGTAAPGLSGSTQFANLIGSSTTDAIEVTGDGKLVINADHPEQAISFDSQGNATFAGVVSAKEIKAGTIDGLDEKFATLAAMLTNATQSAVLGIQAPPSDMSLNSLQVDGLATVSGNLRTKGDGLFEGMLHVIDTLTTSNLLVSQVSDFLGSVIFHSDVSFVGRPTFNNDTAGFAVIKKGADTVSVTFTNAYASVPVITATLSFEKATDSASESSLEQSILQANYGYIITNRSTAGFSIQLNKPAIADMQFSWSAVAIDNVQTFHSDGQTVQTPSATESAQIDTPTLSITPSP